MVVVVQEGGWERDAGVAPAANVQQHPRVMWMQKEMGVGASGGEERVQWHLRQDP